MHGTLLDGYIAAAVFARLPGALDLAAARLACRFWRDATHWFLVAAAAQCLEGKEGQLGKEAALGLLRQLDRRPAAEGRLLPPGDRGWVGGASWQALRCAWEVPVPWPGGAAPVFAPELLRLATPRRLAGVPAAAERAERCAACKLAHGFTRRLFRKGDLRDRVRTLACYFVQLTFMYVSVEPGDAHLAAAAAVSLASLGLDGGTACAGQLRDALVEIEAESRAEQGGPGRLALSEHDKKVLCEKVFEIKLVLLRALRFDLAIELPHEHVDRLVPRLLAYLPGGASLLARDFRTRLRELAREDDDEDTDADAMSAAALTQLLAGLARKFLDDMFLSMSPLLAPPTALAAGAVLAGMQAISTSFTAVKLFHHLEAASHWLDVAQVRAALEEWGELRRSQGKPAVFL